MGEMTARIQDEIKIKNKNMGLRHWVIQLPDKENILRKEITYSNESIKPT